MLQQLLLVPLLAPLLAVLLLAAVNPRPPVALRLLIWTSPALPLGAWIAAAAASGAGLSGAATALALRQGGGGATVRSTVRPPRRRRWSGSDATEPDAATPAGPAPAAAPTWGPSRAAGDPAPTVEVPFRVIRKAGSQAGGSEARVVGDGWDQPLSDGWD